MTLSRLLGCLVTLIVCVCAGHTGAQVQAPAGRKLTAIPLVNFSSDDGAGYGMRLNLFDYDGTTIPYRSSYSVQAFFSTKGKWAHRFYVDMPNLRPGRRVEFEALYEKEDYANYYGGRSDGLLDFYTREQKTFKQEYPKAKVTWIESLRGSWRFLTRVQVGRNDVTPNQQAGNILFDTAPRGAGGGTNIQTGVALRYDSRDDYNNSTTGILEELLIEYGLGNEFNGGRITFDHRHFLPSHRSSDLLRIDTRLARLPAVPFLTLHVPHVHRASGRPLKALS